MGRKITITQPLLFGILFGLSINLLQLLLLSDAESYTGSKLASWVFVNLLVLAFILLFRSYYKKVNGVIHFTSLLLRTIIFSAADAAVLGLGHFINATFIDPEWGQKALEASQEKWAASNYSKEAIAGQVEWTGTFQNPAKWALSSAFMITCLSSLIGGVMALFYYVRSRVRAIDPIPQT